MTLTVEHTGALRVDLSFCTTFADGADLARATDIGLCMEVSSCFAERDLLTRIGAARDVLAHVQVSDFVVGSLCTPDRAVPGDGDIPLDRIIGEVLDAGYGGAYYLVRSSNSALCASGSTTVNLPSAWNDRISSFKTWYGCSGTIYDGTAGSGASYGPSTAASSVGSMNDKASSVRVS